MITQTDEPWQEKGGWFAGAAFPEAQFSRGGLKAAVASPGGSL
jgi:hypothetical protein